MAEAVEFDGSLILESTINLDGSGNYYSSWIATNDLSKIRVGIYGAGGGTITIQHSLSSVSDYFVAPPTTITTTGGSGVGEVDLYGRYFRLRVDTGSASATARLTIRAIERLG